MLENEECQQLLVANCTTYDYSISMSTFMRQEFLPSTKTRGTYVNPITVHTRLVGTLYPDRVS